MIALVALSFAVACATVNVQSSVIKQSSEGLNFQTAAILPVSSGEGEGAELARSLAGSSLHSLMDLHFQGSEFLTVAESSKRLNDAGATDVLSAMVAEYRSSNILANEHAAELADALGSGHALHLSLRQSSDRDVVGWWGMGSDASFELVLGVWDLRNASVEWQGVASVQDIDDQWLNDRQKMSQVMDKMISRLVEQLPR